MKKIILFEPGIGTDNLGDQVIVDGVKRAIEPLLDGSFLIEFSTHTPLYNRHTAHCEYADYKLICGSNLLVGNFGTPIRFKQWPVNYFTAASLKPCILVGVGAQKYGQKFGPYTKIIYNKILSKDYIHSVRDGFTESQLRNAGFDNVLNTGCPTMWGMTQDVCESIRRTKTDKVVFTLTDYRKNPSRDRQLISILKKEYSELWFWPQGSRDLLYLEELKEDKGIRLIGPSLTAYDEFLSGNDTDYVGTRLHGGMRALQHRRRTIILGIDNRANELKRDYNIPVIEQENVDQLSELIHTEWATEIKLPVSAISQFLAQFKIMYPS